MNRLVYIIITIIAIIFGQIVNHIENKLIPLSLEKINYKEFFKSLKKDYNIDLKYSVILIILFNLVYYINGDSINTYIYMSIIPVLLIVFSIDYKIQIIPDEVHVYLICVSIINMLLNSSIVSYVLGALIGGGIFFLISFISYLLLKKEGMGLGDVKLMLSLGLLFGIKKILVITLLSFIIGALVGMLLILLKKKDKNSYIPFGPFIVISVIIIMFINPDYIIDIYISFCSIIGIIILNIIKYNRLNI